MDKTYFTPSALSPIFSVLVKSCVEEILFQMYVSAEGRDPPAII